MIMIMICDYELFILNIHIMIMKDPVLNTTSMSYLTTG